MLCINCGNEFDEAAGPCPTCSEVAPTAEAMLGADNPAVAPANTTPASPVVKLPSQFSIKTKAFIAKSKTFVVGHKKQVIAVAVGLVLIITAVILFFAFYDFTTLKWDSKTDIKLTHVEPTTLSIGVIAKDKNQKPITNIEWIVNGGEVKATGAKVVWLLPRMTGKFKITAKTPSGKNIEKEINVYVLNETPISQKTLEIDPSGDEDKDGIINSDEIKYKTDIYLADTDSDGLTDNIEINILKTDPLKADTDADGLNDGNEMDLGLDPLKADSKGDGVKDGARTLNYKVEDNDTGVSLGITGKGDIASSTIDLSSNNAFGSIDGVINKIYNFYTPGKLENAVAKIRYDKDTVIAQGLSEDNLSLYYFNTETKQLEKIDSTLDKTNQTITADIKHFSQYLIADTTRVKFDRITQIMFIIDNSGSMYSAEQLKTAGLNYSGDDIGNDVNLKRLSLTKDMIKTLTGNYEFGLGQFAGNFDNLLSTNFSGDKNIVLSKVDKINNVKYFKESGTNIIEALNSGIDNFSIKNGDSRYIVIMTDGNNNRGDLDDAKASIISNAISKDIRICAIGLGENVDSNELSDIATGTGCGYYNASIDAALDEMYSKVGADINYNYVDTDRDFTVDGMVEADSGFVNSRDGFSFANFSSTKSNGGNCHGMAIFAMKYFTHTLSVNMDELVETGVKKGINNPSGLDINAPGYNLKNTKFNNYGINLYDFQFNDMFTLSTEMLGGGRPDDYRRYDKNNQTMYYTDKYKKIYENAGYKFVVEKNDGSSYSKNDGKVAKSADEIIAWEKVILDPTSDNFNKNVDNDEKQLINAIYRHYVFQMSDSDISFGTDPDKSFKIVDFNLRQGIPVVISISNFFEGISHTINVTKIIRDIDNTNKLKFEVYDNNNPFDKNNPENRSYIEVERSKFSKYSFDATGWSNKYQYKFRYESNGISVTIPIVEPETFQFTTW